MSKSKNASPKSPPAATVQPTAPIVASPRIAHVTITIPVLVGPFEDAPGRPDDGGIGHVDGRLGRGAAQGCQRVLLAQLHTLTESATRLPYGLLPRAVTNLGRIDAIRLVFEAIERAAHQIQG